MTIKRLAGSREEKLSREPVAMPVGTHTPPPLHDLIARMVRTAIEEEKAEQFETMEEADDFEEEDPDVLNFTQYEFDDSEPPPFEYPDPVEQDASPAEAETGDSPDPNDSEPDSP